jgi:serine/threonine-protein kinase
MKCPECQSELPEGKNFCGNCGIAFHHEEKHSPLTKTIIRPLDSLPDGLVFANRYRIIEELGRGGMGTIYRAMDTKLEEEIALKLIRPEIALDSQAIKRFHHELRMARRIVHKNIGRMYELMEDEGTHYITMEYISGEDLRHLIRRVGPLPLPRTLAIAKQVCSGLSEAHRQGIVHRDIKPGNIMIDRNGDARILDFGISRSLRAEGMTLQGVAVGTPEYMSPEQIECVDIDCRSDIYSLGIVLYEMATGCLPFKGETPLSVVVKHKNEIPRNPRELNNQIPEDLSGLILKCLEKDKVKRYQSADELGAALDFTA